MQLCVMIEGQEGVSWAEWVALARAVEDNGLHGLFRSDHYTSFHAEPAGALDAWATLAALAPITERIRLGTLVSPATFRHPSELARVAVTVDHASGGRLDVGVGAGWNEDEHARNGFVFPELGERFDRFEEYVEILTRSWSAETFDFHGRFWTLEQQRALPGPVQTPHPPLINGGAGGPRALRIAARWADEYNAVFVSPPQAGAIRARLDAACRAIGREPAEVPLSLMALIAVGRTAAEAEAYQERGAPRFRGDADRWQSGSLEEIEALLGRYADAGVTRVYLQHPNREDFAALEVMGELQRRVA